MFERFTTSAWTVVDQAVLDAGAMGSPELRTGHLLLALCADDGPAGRSLAEAGISEALVRTSLVEPDPTSHPLDRQALLSLGIDLDDVRRVIEQNFGAGALDRAALSAASAGGEHRRRPGWMRRRRGGALRFDADASAALGLALRAAVHLQSRSLGSEHLLLGLLKAPTSDVARALDAAEVDPVALRQNLLILLRRSA